MLRPLFCCLVCCVMTAAAAKAPPALDLFAAPAPPAAAAYGAGFVPPPVDLSHLQLPPPAAAKIRDLPARFDWRASGLVSPVKDQGACGSCYAFAAAAELESRVLRDHSVLVDCSENHLKECHFEASSCAGGNAQLLANLLTRQGAVLEACDPYVPSDAACNQACAPQFSVLDWIWLSGNTVPATAALKQALLDHGPLSTTVYAGDGANPAWAAEFSGWSGGSGLYFTGENQPNHAVVLVGWDDGQPHTGGGEGCWIVKNSWSEAWGDACGFGATGGYFYLAYGSASLGKYSSAITEIMPSYPELAIMAWDDGGWTGSFGTGTSPTIWGLARFDPAGEAYLHRVEFWTTDTTERVDVYVYDSFNGSTLGGVLAAVLDASFPAAGYHSVALAEPLPLAAGNDYYVAIRLVNASYNYPLAVDGQGSRGNGRTWIGVNGSTWYDLSASYNCTAGIRIRTSPHEALPVSDPDAPAPPAVPPHAAGFNLEAARPNPFNPRTSLVFTLDRRAAVNLRIYDLRGRLVATLVQAVLPAGRHEAQWSGRDEAGGNAPAGIYLCRLDDGLRWRSQRLVLVK